MGLKFRIQIDAQPDDVFAYVSDLSRHGEWSTGQLKVEGASGGPIGVGSTFRSTQRFQGRPATAALTIREYEPSRRLQFSAVQTTGGGKPATFVHTFTFTSSNGGTLVERDLTRENAPPLAALGIVFYPAIRADAMKGLRGLKQKVESGAR